MPKMRTFSIYGGEVIAALTFVAGVHAWGWGDRGEGQILILLAFISLVSCQHDRLKVRAKALEKQLENNSDGGD